MLENSSPVAPALRNPDVVWWLGCAALVLLMQTGFWCRRSGYCKPGSGVNAAVKSLAGFCVSNLAFWGFGFALMFGASWNGLTGTSGFAVDLSGGASVPAFFLLQMMCCGAMVAIVSGNISERARLSSFLAMSLIGAGLIYPLFGHWAWGRDAAGTATGWLAQIGFVDFAGASVIHSVAGWFSLAAVIILSSRRERPGGLRAAVRVQNVSLSMLGTFLLWFGWFGATGGSAAAEDDRIVRVLVNTNLSAAAGGLSALLLAGWIDRCAVAGRCLNGVVAGLVGISAACQAVTPATSILIGGIAGIISVWSALVLEWFAVDDRGAASLHALCGVWGTLALALFGNVAAWGTGLTRTQQLAAQALGASICFVWSFGIGGLLLLVLDRSWRLRAKPHKEQALSLPDDHARSPHVAESEADAARLLDQIADVLTEWETPPVKINSAKPDSSSDSTIAGPSDCRAPQW